MTALQLRTRDLGVGDRPVVRVGANSSANSIQRSRLFLYVGLEHGAHQHYISPTCTARV
jgi:hypothetical protein